jgi:hypothetical protein
MSQVYALVATIPVPERRRSVARLLAELAHIQTRKVDGVILVLDGYGEDGARRLSSTPRTSSSVSTMIA